LFCRSYDLSTYPGKFLWLEAQKYPQWYKDFLKKQLLQVQLKVKFHSGSFAKTPEAQARDLEKECYNCLKPEQKEKFLQNAEIVSFKFTADNSPRPRRGKRRLFRAAAWHLYLSMSSRRCSRVSSTPRTRLSLASRAVLNNGSQEHLRG
jgi:hypothetical protein